ncbi:MAG: alanine dehydrogenase [Calditrichaeota bacterium]|nr:alanine dehydrogenase [Calditrichota bacterium]MCB0268647.1 alanine dehydrogenase [Calditrichota bacterium]MCB0287294.1 alanine dehydrogenase [Calditrichota bacterium]MCB9069711.1 alanine dehydrogenase [Calditrichia bacterium]
MNFGIPKEVRPFEYRVGLTPAAVRSLVRNGHTVYFEHNAGLKAGFTDQEYETAGGKLVYTASEAYGRADVLVKVSRPTEDEYRFFNHQQAIVSFLNLAVASEDLLEQLATSEITAIACETIETNDNKLTVLQALSEITGRMSPVIAGDLLGSFKGGRGILLSGIPGIAPASVVIIGAGVLGCNSARAFRDLGADVTLLDNDLMALRRVDRLFDAKLPTMYANAHNIEKAVKFADVLVTTAASAGEKAPVLITRQMLKSMKSRAIILDFAINSGGNVETSRPTTLADPSFVEEGIIHYCVPNVPSRVSRTSSYALSNALIPYLLQMGELGIDAAIRNNAELKRGVNTFQGKLSHAGVAEALKKDLEVKL